MTTGKHILFSLALLFSAHVSFAQKSPSSESDLKKQAEKLFEKESYQEATPMYSQLLSLYPRDAIFNYRYGVCLIMSGQDKTGASTYLEAAAKVKETDPDVHYYLGRSYMFMERFNDALAEFAQFKKTGTPAKQSKLGVDRAIENCNNANVLRMDRKNVVVLQKSKVNRAAFFASYDFTDAAGKLLTTPDRFLTPIDKAKMPNPVMFMTKDGETIYFASYGKKGENGKDLYRIIKLPDGSWSEPSNLGGIVNTNADEDYAYLDKDGRTLYFSSTGHNSIGGYDIFKSQYDFNSGQWSAPVNVGIPINTVDDDLFFMPSTKGETASYSTAVETETGRIEFRNLGLGKASSNLAIINGQYISEDQVTRRDARITVIRSKDNGVVTSVKTDRMGQYELVLPAGEEYTLLVEGGSYLPHAETFSVPSGNIPGMHQKVAMNKTPDKEVLTMSNYFTPSAIDSSIASLEKPTQVKTSEFDMKDTASSKMQAITFEGKTLFVAAPTLTSSGVKTVDVSGLAVNENPDATVSGQTTASENTSSANEAEAVSKNAETENVKGAAVIPPAASEKTSNSELVKMAFEDALTIKEEANTLKQEAVERRLEARSLDSLSKEQLKQANQLLAAGDQDLSKEVFKQSQENVLAAQDKTKEAQQLDTDAHEKKLEAETSYQEAVKLMKEFKVDTNSTSYQAIAIKDKETEGQEATSEEPSAVQNINPHAIRSRQLAVEADSLFNESKYVADQALATTDKKQKEFLNEKAKELNDQGESRLAESRLESNLAEKDKTLAAAAEEEKELNAATPENNTAVTAGNKSSGEKMVEPTAAAKTEANETSPVTQPENKSSNSSESKDASSGAKSENPSVVTPSVSTAGNTASAGIKSSPVERKPRQKLPPVPNVDPAAQQHFETYSNQLDESKYLEAASKETEAKLLKVNTPATRDSLEAKTIELNQESIRLWQSANLELAIAKEIDPEIVGKMADAEKTFALQSEQPVAKQSVAGNSSVQAEQKSNTGAESISPAITDVKPASAENGPLTEAKPLPGKEEKSATPAAGNSVTTTENQPAAAAEVLDTTKPAYQEYKATQEEIVEKQTETVNIFVEGMQLSKQATAIKKEEMKLRDQAVVTTDKKEKARLEERADSMAMEAELLTDKSKSMLSVAQKNTNEVKTLTAKSDKLKSELVVKNLPEEKTVQPVAVNPTSAPSSDTASVSIVPSAQTQTGNVKSAGEEIAGTQQAGNTEPDRTTSDSSAALTPSLALVQEENKPQQESQTTGKPQDNAKQQETIGGENKTGSESSEPGLKNESGSATPAIIGQGVSAQTVTEPAPPTTTPVVTGTAEEAKTAPAQAVSENASGEKIKESGTKTFDDIPAREIKPSLEEEPAAEVAYKEADKPTAEVVQTKVEKGQKVSSQPPTKLVFENEVSDATTFSLAKANASSESNTIPMDPSLPEGLVFKVQIGAFRKPLPASSFNNLQPLSGETTRPGWIRYCLGLFRTFEPANLLKKEVRTMGYKDAFVVAYYNGKRIPLYEAYAIVSKANAADKQTYSNVSTNEFKQLEKFEIKKSSFDLKPDDDTKAFYGTTENVPADMVEYAVQVGVYKTSRTPSALASLVPLNTEQMTSGLYRFTTGRFDNRQSADSMRRIAVNTGIKDAFVVIYRGGKKASQSEAQQIVTAARREAAAKTAAANEPATAQVPATPAPNETINASDIIFKIQLGAFRENVPFNTVSSFLAIADKGITQETDARGLHIFYAGQYTDYNEALAARAEIVSKGVKDAFIVAFVKGKRTNATDALKLLNRN